VQPVSLKIPKNGRLVDWTPRPAAPGGRPDPASAELAAVGETGASPLSRQTT
jgi:hypothetical protein